ncbi:hypothetical protein PILCRDRAFT_824517 [Piloderma croceum F 1598]|uniref:Uncharacterized protein n=1 Tax=Piloderma croceum (strain F 1598) TaxID=765440 RepID=A0A0C3BLV3_PILCF|nr:hypothetical protein PILCRDRAFT_824517 [Piloderma croceum F 1598]
MSFHSSPPAPLELLKYRLSRFHLAVNVAQIERSARSHQLRFPEDGLLSAMVNRH